MTNITDESELDAYYLASPTNQRAAGVMWPAIVERRVDKLFGIGLRPDKSVHNELFQPSGALGNYAVKVRLAYLLGWIEKDIYDDLLLLAKIRNRFAHVIEAKDFSDERISAWLKNMAAYKSLQQMKEAVEKIAAKDSSVKNLAILDAVNDALTDPQMGFRYCIDTMLHHLDKCGQQMEKNLAGLPGNWLVRDDGSDLVNAKQLSSEKS